MQARDLPAIQHEHAIGIDANPNGLIESGGKSLPFEVFQAIVDAAHSPNFAWESGDEGRSPRIKRNSRQLHDRVNGFS